MRARDLARKEDCLPTKFFKPLVGTGPTSGVAVGRDEFEEALEHYYEFHNWNQNGIPTKTALITSNIEWAAEYLPT